MGSSAHLRAPPPFQQLCQQKGFVAPSYSHMQATMSGRRNICSLLLLAAAISAVSAQQNADVRLVGGDTSAEGRVEVFYDGTWGTICDDSWHLRDANVVCQQLGFEKAERVWFRAEFGEGTGPIWLDQMNCNGGESSVLECGHNGWGVHDCQHREDASVRCSRPAVVKPRSLPVRLSCPKYVQNGTCNTCPDKQHPAPTDCAVNQPAVEGIVEVFHGEVWRPVLGDRWSIEASRVVCGELGYPVAFSPPALSVLWANWNGHYLSGCDSGSGGDSADPNCDSFHAVENDAFRQRLRSALLNDLECSGKESQLLSCYFGGVGVVDNPSMEVATVKCGFFPHSGCFSGNAEVSACVRPIIMSIIYGCKQSERVDWTELVDLLADWRTRYRTPVTISVHCRRVGCKYWNYPIAQWQPFPL